MAVKASNHSLPDLCVPDSFSTYGCRVNALSADRLLERYKALGFLYPAKLRRLTPHIDEILDNWDRGMNSQDQLLQVVSCAKEEAWTAITTWRPALDAVNAQHWVSTGNPAGSRAVMLAIQSHHILSPEKIRCGSLWFQPAKILPRAVFGTLVDTIGPSLASCRTYRYVQCPLTEVATYPMGIDIVRWHPGLANPFFSFAVQMWGRVYALAERFDKGDIFLDETNALYKRNGLFRHRELFLAIQNGTDKIVGAIVAHRGPLGFNLSFLENRCDLLMDPGIRDEDKAGIAKALISAATPVYATFSPQCLMVVTDMDMPVLESIGGIYLRDYARSLWLREGFRLMMDHFESVYRQFVGRPDS